MEKKVTKEHAKKAVKNCFAACDIIDIRPYSKGNINRMFEIRLKNSREVLMRVFNEPWKAEKEAFIYRDIRAHVDVPVPEIYCADSTMELLPYAYTLMSKINGMQIDRNYMKYKNKKIFEKAGEILAKIHKINFPKYGWIMGNEIRPAFHRWRDFVWHDIGLKLSKLKNISKITGLSGDVEHCLNNMSYLLDIDDKPSLIHKDYHCSHILCDKENVTGIIDVEWAIAGHTENDFIKMELWAFSRFKNIRNSFFAGYLRHGHISDDYPGRKKLYELWHWISMVNISNEIKNKAWLDFNIKALEKFLKNEYH